MSALMSPDAQWQLKHSNCCGCLMMRLQQTSSQWVVWYRDVTQQYSTPLLQKHPLSLARVSLLRLC